MSDRSPGEPFVFASSSAMASSSVLFDLRPASAVRSRFLYSSIVFLLVCVPAAAQEIDTALYQSDRPDYSLLDDIDEPDERKAMSSLLAAEEPQERLKLAKDFLELHPQSWHLGRVFGVASRAAIRLGDHAAAPGDRYFVLARSIRSS